MCVVYKDNGNIKREFTGEDCDQQFLDFLPDVNIKDLAVMKINDILTSAEKELDVSYKNGICRSVIKGTKVMKTDVKYKGKTLHFKDTLPILTCKLSELPKMFIIPDTQKEILPYKYYTLDGLNNGAICVISQAGLTEDSIWNDEDRESFIHNIDNIPGCRIDEDHFNMWKYAWFYYHQDVNILRLGFSEFRKGFKKDFEIDPYNFISISSLANEAFKHRVYYPNGNLYEIGGIVSKFCAQAVYGGRCMTAYNKRWHVIVPLCDFDAVSLYPQLYPHNNSTTNFSVNNPLMLLKSK
ncbi:hypothetical protein M9Y10_029721 [Tritrichomonas musculus]|uniref:DNA-directed DNA polymerase n=1 Tax=Tritrichomonas musculus TaxID=1915356 RepID=A0ABR2KMW9_9EUKA